MELLLKQTIAIKAVVTEDFKKYLRYELKKSTETETETDFFNVLILEKKRNEIKDFELGSLVIQGTVDGFIKVKKGDNLYNKLGGFEIIIKDGIIQDIIEPS